MRNIQIRCGASSAKQLTMTSCEPHRSSAYSDDIRWRIVWQRHALGRTHQSIATNVNVDVSTVGRIHDIFSATGTVSKKIYPAEKAYRKISEPVQLFILHLLLEKPGIYLREITADIKCTLGLVSPASPFTHEEGSGTLRIAGLCSICHYFLGVLMMCECTLSKYYVIVWSVLTTFTTRFSKQARRYWC